MRVVVQLDDDTAAVYQNEAVERGVELDEVLADRLRRAGQLHPQQPYLILTDRDLTRTEAALGGLPIRDCQTLLDRLTRLARIRFGEHDLDLTPGQLEEVAWTAHKQGRTVAQQLALVWERFGQEFFSLIPGQK